MMCKDRKLDTVVDVFFKFLIFFSMFEVDSAVLNISDLICKCLFHFHLFACQFTYPFILLSDHLAIHPFIHLRCVHPFIFLIPLFICLVHSFIQLFSACPSLHQFIQSFILSFIHLLIQVSSLIE